MAPSASPTAQIASALPALRLLTGLLIATLVIAALYFGRDLLIPLALAILLGFLLDPAVARLKRWGLPRMLAVFVMVGLTLTMLTGSAVYLGAQVSALSKDLPTYQSTIREKLGRMRKYVKGPSAWDGALSTYSTVEKEIAKATETPPDGKAGGRRNIQRVEIIPAPKQPMVQLMDWLGIVSTPILTAGMVLLFVILILLGRNDLRERLLRLMGGNLHLATDALDEASQRIGRYLRMQLVVNATYGIPMSIALLAIGVPGAVLWGAVAAIMRFVPYIGPMISAVLPLALAFAVDPTWNMFLWTLGVIVVLELLGNNVIEPWLYGASTGLSPLSIILAATFWTSIWGPIGLILSTPLTVCLLVLGRYLPALHFMEVLLGSEPVLNPPQRLYQRLLGGDIEEAVDMASEAIAEQLPPSAKPADVAEAVTAFYDTVTIPALRLTSERYSDIATSQHRLRMVSGMAEVLEELEELYPRPAEARSDSRILCVGGRWEIDSLAAGMMSHVLALHGHLSDYEPTALRMGNNPADAHRLDNVRLLCLSAFHPQPLAQVRYWCRRLTRRWPDVKIILALWNAPPGLLSPEMPQQLGVAAIVNSIHELALRVDAVIDTGAMHGPIAASIPENDAERVAALHASGVLQPAHTADYRQFVQRAADVFDVKYAQLAWIDENWVHTPASLLRANDGARLPRAQAICAHIVSEATDIIVPDIVRDPRFADYPMVTENALRFYAGVSIADKNGMILGCFSLMDTEPRTLAEVDLTLMKSMAKELIDTILKPGETTQKNIDA